MSCPIDEYEAILERIYSVYLDATEGFRHIAKTSHFFLNPEAPPKIRDAQGRSPEGYVIYALGSQETGDYMELSARTGAEILFDNRDDGPNWDFMGGMCIVAAYQFWEDYYRTRIAAHLGRLDQKLKIPIFGDLRRFRRCIVHNRARWTDDVGALECFVLEEITNGAASQELHFPKDIITSLWWQMRLALAALRKVD